MTTTRQAMYLQCNTEAFLCNNCCSGKALIITHSEGVCSLSYAACNGHAPIVICGRSASAVLIAHNLMNSAVFEKKVIQHKMCFDFLYNFV